MSQIFPGYVPLRITDWLVNGIESWDTLPIGVRLGGLCWGGQNRRGMGRCEFDLLNSGSFASAWVSTAGRRSGVEKE